MEYNSIKNHPDFLEILSDLGKAQKAYERNMKIAGGMITAGSALMTAGIILYKVQVEMLKRKK